MTCLMQQLEKELLGRNSEAVRKTTSMVRMIDEEGRKSVVKGVRYNCGRATRKLIL